MSVSAQAGIRLARHTPREKRSDSPDKPAIQGTAHRRRADRPLQNERLRRPHQEARPTPHPVVCFTSASRTAQSARPDADVPRLAANVSSPAARIPPCATRWPLTRWRFGALDAARWRVVRGGCQAPVRGRGGTGRVTGRRPPVARGDAGARPVCRLATGRRRRVGEVLAVTCLKGDRRRERVWGAPRGDASQEGNGRDSEQDGDAEGCCVCTHTHGLSPGLEQV